MATSKRPAVTPAAPGLSLAEPLLDHISDAFLMVDLRRGRLLRVNREAAALLGYSEPELLAQEIDRVLPAGRELLAAPEPGDGRPRRCRGILVDRRRKAHDVRLVAIAGGEHRWLVLARPERRGRADDDREELVETVHEFPSIVGRSEQIREVCRLIGLVAKTDATVLVQGESGTGKELVGEAIHFHSHRSPGPLVKVNCAALSETLLESELFGHRKGAFTGAIKDRKGRFKLADGGTIILDEIDSMPPSGQAKLLRVLQEQEFEPVGASTTVRVDVRVVAVTNAELKAEIEAGRFREDLYYRLAAFPIRLAPLRERKVDIPLLARHFLKRYSRSLKKRARDLSLEAASRLVDYPWPGNVRELANAVEYAVILEKGTEVSVRSLPEKLRGRPSRSPTLRERLTQVEKRLILEALSKAGGVKSRAAKLLGVDRRNLGYFLNKHHIRWQRQGG